MAATPALAEDYYESGNAPHEALGRAARKLMHGGGMYLGGGVGVEKLTGPNGSATYALTRAVGKSESFPGPLSAVLRAFSLAGTSTAPDTPGGTSSVVDPAAAARLRELNDSERQTQQDIERYQARIAAKVQQPQQPIGIPTPAAINDESWEVRRLAELRRELKQIRAEKTLLISSGKVAESAQTAALSVTHAPIGKGGSNFITRSKPGNTGQLPAYIQNVRNAIMRGGKDESTATAIAIGRVRDWAEGKGNVGPEVKAAAAKAIAEWDALRAGSKAKTAAKSAGRKLGEAELFDLVAHVRRVDAATGRLAEVGAATMVGLAEAGIETIADDLILCARLGDLDADVFEELLAESFETALHPHAPHGPKGGEFIATSRGTFAIAKRGTRGLPEGSGKARPSGRIRGPVGPDRTDPHAARNQRKLTPAEAKSAVGTGGRSVVADTAKLHSGEIASTEDLHRRRNADGSHGAYTPERQDLHARIASALLQGAGAHPGKARAIFLAGGPASGKTSLINNGHVRIPKDAVDVNPDIVRELLPEYDRLKTLGDTAAAAKTHEEASHIAGLVNDLALTRHHHVVVDGTGNSGAMKYRRKVENARDHGHKTEVHYASISTDEAVRRAQLRASKSGRHVPEGYLRSAHKAVSQHFVHDDIRGLPGVGVHVYDNNGKKPVKVFERHAGGRESILHKNKFGEFVAKATELGG